MCFDFYRYVYVKAGKTLVPVIVNSFFFKFFDLCDHNITSNKLIRLMLVDRIVFIIV